MSIPRLTALAASTVAVGAAVVVPATAHAKLVALPAQRHVLLVSVDGLHQSDLTRWAAAHPSSALAKLVRRGRSYTNAVTPFPSDSFPGMVGQVTGGNPRSTGIYYDVSYNAALLPPGTTHCAGVSPGTTVAYDESLDRDQSRIDAGQGLARLPGSILSLTADATRLIDPKKLPVDPRTCAPVYPHSYLKVNTLFEVARAHGLRTAWSDKHAAYDVLNGPSGTGIQDLFAPEINSDARGTTGDWTQDNAATQRYDAYKVRAVLNEIDGFDHGRSRRVGTPAVFGLNFQSVSTAQKLPVSGGAAGGYSADGAAFGPVLTGALRFVDRSVGALVAEIHRRHLEATTTVILSAKHGQSPEDSASLTRVDDGALFDALNAAWKASRPGAADLVSAASDDDGMLLWLSDRSTAATQFAASFLLSYSGNGTGTDGRAAATDISGKPRAYVSSGLTGVLAGPAAATFMGVRARDARVPDVIGIAAHGVVYTGGTKKIAEHGGFDAADRHVPLVVAGPGVERGRITTSVETTQIAPSILVDLGIDPRQLRAVRLEGTPVLP